MDIGPIPFNDTLLNLMTGLGTSRAKATNAHFVQRGRLSQQQIMALYDEDFLGGKIVDLPADDATHRAWRTFQGSKSVIEAVESEERRLGLQETLNAAFRMSSRDGGACLILGAGGDPEQPLDPSSIGRGGLNFVRAMSRFDNSVGPPVRDPASPYYLQPSDWRLAMANGAMLRIHPSRVIPIITTPGADPLRTGEPWANSVYDRIYEPLRWCNACLQSVAELVQIAKEDTISIPGLSAGAINPEYRDQVIKRFSLAASGRSVVGATLLDAEETWSQRTQNFAGFPDLLDRYLNIIAGAAGLPVVFLLGTSPKGLDATGEADLQIYYSRIATVQQRVLGPVLDRIDACLVPSATGRKKPRSFFYTWQSLWSLDETKKAEIDLKRAQAFGEYVKTGLFPPDVIAQAAVNQMEQDGFAPGIGAAWDASRQAVAPALSEPVSDAETDPAAEE